MLVTNKAITIDDFDDDRLYFLNWFYQKNKKQGLGGKYVANIDRMMELLYYDFHDQHWDDYQCDFGYKTEHSSIISEILADCNIEVAEFYVILYDNLDNMNCDLSEDDRNALEELGLITVAFIPDDLKEIYCDIFEKQNIDYIVLDDELYIADYIWGYEFIFSISNKENNITGLETIWRENDGMCTTFYDNDFTYFAFFEDMENYGESFNLSEFFANLYKYNLINFDETDILQMTFNDFDVSNKLKMFFADLLRSIECTREVVF